MGKTIQRNFRNSYLAVGAFGAATLALACASETLPIEEATEDGGGGSGGSAANDQSTGGAPSTKDANATGSSSAGSGGTSGSSTGGNAAGGKSGSGAGSSKGGSGGSVASGGSGGTASVPLVPEVPLDYSVIAGEPGGVVGPSAAFVGDLDGDGYDEWVLLDSGGSGPQKAIDLGTRGAAYLFYGTPEMPVSQSVLDADLVLYGASESVTGLGDIDGDGHDDFAFTADCQWESNCDATNGVHIIYGGADRYEGVYRSDEVGALWRTEVWSTGETDFPSPTGTHSRVLKVSRAGDVNGDGLNDIVFDFGTTVDLGAETVRTLLLLGNSDRASQVPGPDYADAVFEGTLGDARVDFGSAGAGDLDGDGYADLVIGLAHVDPTMYTGQIALFYGGATRFEGTVDLSSADALFDWKPLWLTNGGLGDLDGDGYDDVGLSEYYGGSRLHVVYGSAKRLSGTIDSDSIDYTVTTPSGDIHGVGAGDVDGDGHVDLLIGNAMDQTRGFQAGALSLIRGTEDRFDGYWMTTSEQAVIYGRVLELDGEQASDDLGYGASSGGDANGDGYDDMLVTATSNVIGDADGGSVVLILGGPLD